MARLNGSPDSPNHLLRPLIAVVSLGGIAVLTGAALSWSHEDELLLVALSLMTVASERFDFKPFPNSRVSLSIAFVFAAAILGGLSGAALIGSVSVSAHFALHRPAVYKAIFNEGCLLLSAGAFVGVLKAFSSTYSEGDSIAILGPALLGTAAAFFINTGLVSLAIALSSGQRPFAVWDAAFRWFLPHYVALGVLAVAMSKPTDDGTSLGSHFSSSRWRWPGWRSSSTWTIFHIWGAPPRPLRPDD